jgi:hypothetical protein
MKGPVLSTFAAGGAYAPLHKYLSSRFADALVLTFAQIEDLLGFPLPEPARLDSAWWAPAAPGATASVQSQAWTLAKRTATPNLPAQIVLFERASP